MPGFVYNVTSLLCSVFDEVNVCPLGCSWLAGSAGATRRRRTRCKWVLPCYPEYNYSLIVNFIGQGITGAQGDSGFPGAPGARVSSS